MRVHVADHPLITHKLTVLRDAKTTSPVFRALVDELMTLLAYEGTRNVRVEPIDIVTPVAATTGVRIAEPKPLIVPIQRAGLERFSSASHRTHTPPRRVYLIALSSRFCAIR
jgi:uracil phosphoribosyltransferase